MRITIRELLTGKRKEEGVVYHAFSDSPLTKNIQDSETLQKLRKAVSDELEKLNKQTIPTQEPDKTILEKKKTILQCCLTLLQYRINNVNKKTLEDQKEMLLSKMIQARSHENKQCNYRLAVSRRASAVHSISALFSKNGYMCESATAGIVDAVADFFKIEILALPVVQAFTAPSLGRLLDI